MQVEFPSGYIRRDQGLDRKPDVVQSAGRQVPTVSQNLTVISCIVERNLFQTLSANPNPEYPLTKAEELKAEKGEVAVFVNFNRNVQDNPNSIERPVRTRANGMSSDERIHRAGIILKGADGSEKKDNSVSVCVSGMQTITNTGTETIQAGDIVMVDWPEYVTKNGKRVPRVAVRSELTCFHWAIRPYRSSEVMDQFVSVTHEIVDALKNADMLMDDSTGTEKKQVLKDPATYQEALDLIKDIPDQFSPIKWGKAGKNSPVHRYARWMLYMMGAKQLTDWRTAEDDETKKTVERTIHGQIVIRRRRTLAARNRQITQYGPRNGIQKTIWDMSFPSLMMAEQQNYYRRMFLGTAMKTSKPGESLDILVGFGTLW